MRAVDEFRRIDSNEDAEFLNESRRIRVDAGMNFTSIMW
jgi:hypothetical protein